MLETRNHLEDYESDSRAGLRTTVCFLGYKNSENFLKYLAFFYPLALFPAFFMLSQNFKFLFLILSCLFLLLFLYRKKFEIIDTYYGLLSYIVIAVAALYPWELSVI
jgi:1,4-dihydroxy-2-naphthoate octaprenyltransferase